MPGRTEREILADIRRLRHQLDRQRLSQTRAALKAAEHEITKLRAQLSEEPPSKPAVDDTR